MCTFDFMDESNRLRRTLIECTKKLILLEGFFGIVMMSFFFFFLSLEKNVSIF